MTQFDPTEMIARFKERADAVRKRGVPPLEGEARRDYIRQAQLDFMDYAMIGDAQSSVEDGVLVLRIDLRNGDD